MDEYIIDAKKRRNKKSFNVNKKSIKNFISKFLLAIIFFLSSIIFTNINDKNLLLYKEYVLTESLPFTKIKGWYEELFGEVLPKDDNNKMVIKGHLVYKNIENYKDGEVLTLTTNTLINSLQSGIVVYCGEKDDFGNTVIIQGVDGVDIWYGNL